MRFNTLTKSYFGPAYAKATKVQRATQLYNDRILVIENVTQLDDIPFSDRFRVLERWVLEVVEGGEEFQDSNDDSRTQSVKKSSSSSDAALETSHTKASSLTYCKLAVYAEVQMLKSCSWEAQIRKKASETFTDVATDWCKSAVVALAATEEQKRKRQKLQLKEVSSSNVVDSTNNNFPASERRPPRIPSLTTTTVPEVSTSTTITPSSLVRQRSKLFAEHKRNFDELDKRIAQGDLEWCSVEVTHSSHLEKYTNNYNEEAESLSLESSAYATVLEYPELEEYELTSSIAGSSIEDEDEVNNTDGSRRKATVLMRTKSRKLLRKLSSRRGGT